MNYFVIAINFVDLCLTFLTFCSSGLSFVLLKELHDVI